MDCVEALLSQTPLHFTLSSLPPDSGFPGGIVYEILSHQVSSTGADGEGGSGAYKSVKDVKIALVGSTNKSWYTTGAFTWLPPLHYKDDTSGAKSCHRLGWICTKEVLSLQFYGTDRSLKSIDFYGIGNASPATQLTFADKDAFAGTKAKMPIFNWLSLVGQVELRKPSVTFAEPMPPDESAAPGIASQPAFLDYGTGFSIHASSIAEKPSPANSPPNPPLLKHKLIFTVDNSFEQTWFHDQSTGRYSFRRFEFDGTEVMKMDAVVEKFVSPASTKGFQKLIRHFCGGALKRTRECAFGQFVVNSYLSASVGNVPFYYQPTLGGSDIESRPTLRGYDNYRFRAPDAALLQAEYDIPVVAPFGAFLFYDVGAVGTAFKDLSFGEAHQDSGLGLSFSVQGGVVAQLYEAFGGGSHRLGYNFTKFF